MHRFKNRFRHKQTYIKKGNLGGSDGLDDRDKR